MRRFWLRLLACAILIAQSLGPVAISTEENDLWLLISSYEDIGLTANDLAFFLVTHGYDATPNRTYVTVTLSGGKEVFLTPNGASFRLADMWSSPPTMPTGPVQVIPSDAIKTNVTYEKSENPKLLREISKYLIFPVTPLGMCYEGSQQLEKSYESFGYNVWYMYDPSGFDSQGHLWVVVEDKADPNTWLAIDSYYGIITGDDYYYTAPYSFAEFKYLDSLNPKWRLT